jgi:hypothetical protein
MDAEGWGKRCMLQLRKLEKRRKQKTGKNQLPPPGQLSSCCGKVKAENA